MKEKIRDLFRQTPATTVIIRNTRQSLDPAFQYFSGLDPKRFDNNILLLEKNKPHPTLLVHSMEFDEDLKRLPLHVVIIDRQKKMDLFLSQRFKNKIVGLNYDTYPYQRVLYLRKHFHPKRLVNISSGLATVRAEKTPQEIKKIKTACKITSEILEHAPEFVKKIRTEKELAEKLENEAFKTVDELAYPTIVAFGKNAGIPHHNPAPQKIGKNNFLLIDFGVKYDGYCADLTRTFFRGKPTEEQQWQYWVVSQSKKRAFELAKPGAIASDLFEAADDVIFSGFKTHIPHALGHGIGLEVHDYPTRMATKETWKLAPNQVVTLEPAIYTRSFGIRIEDDIRITKTGAEYLTRAPEELHTL